MKSYLTILLICLFPFSVFATVDTFDGQTGIDTWDGQAGVDTIDGQVIAGGGVAAPTDQFSANPVFSVGVTATELDNEGTITVASNIATFSIAFPTNVGAGDVVQYDVDSSEDIGNDEYGIIHGISTDRLKAYLLKTNGGNVVNTTATTSVYDIFRAYTSLANCENSIENTNIDADCRDDYDLTDGDLTDADDEDGPLYVTCYADGNDTSYVTIDTTYWSTDADDFIKIYTPFLVSEVGTSQRHSGTDVTGYKLVTGTSNPLITIGPSHVRIEGLVLHNTQSNGNGIGISDAADRPGEWRLYETLVVGPGGTPTKCGFAEDNATASCKYYIKNNIIYDWGTGIRIRKDSPAVAWDGYLYNNTICDCANMGIFAERCDGIFRLKNNLVQNSGSSDYAMSNFGASATTEYIDNLSEDATSPNNEHDSKVVVFEDESGNDFHLDVTDADATDQGASLAADGDLPFPNDIDEDVRGATWSIGADD